MMYAMRTSTLRPGTVEEFEARFAQRAPLPGEVSSIGGFLAHRVWTGVALGSLRAAKTSLRHRLPPQQAHEEEGNMAEYDLIRA
jgi:hypothetical protein